MKKLSLTLAAFVLFAGISFAQQNPDPDPAHGVHKNSNTNKTEKKAANKGTKKTDKKGTKATK